MKTSKSDRWIGLYWAAALVADQNFSRHLRASMGPPRAIPSARATAFIAPALVPLTAAMCSRSSSRSRSSTPQVKAPCEPPPCRASLIDFLGLPSIEHLRIIPHRRGRAPAGPIISWQPAGWKNRDQREARQREEADPQRPQTRLRVDARSLGYLLGRGRCALKHLQQPVVADEVNIVEIDLRLEPLRDHRVVD